MAETVTIEEAQANLLDLIARLAPRDEVIITQNQQPVAKLIGGRPAKRQLRKPGSAQGKLIIHVDDADHLNDFKEYMP